MRIEQRGDRGNRLTAAAGWVAASLGAAHVVVAPWDVRAVWAEVAEAGWWNTFTLQTATTLAELRRSEALWISIGSFGVPMLALGSLIIWNARRRQRVPGWLGIVVVGWGTAMVVVLPASPAWAILVTGALIVAGDRSPVRAAAGTGASVSVDAA